MARDNGKPLTTADVTVQTATVEVQVIKISNRQMTLSVFRQLPTWHVITIGGDPNDAAVAVPDLPGGDVAEVWGTVNYFWQGCGGHGKHLHVVWAHYGRLYRACVGRLWWWRDCTPSPKVDWANLRGDKVGLSALGEAEWDDMGGGDYVAVRGRDTPAAEVFRQQWNRLVDELADLPQLYIAV
jgi:hypothetical protein